MRGTRSAIIANMPPYVERDQQHHNHENNHVEAMEDWTKPRQVPTKHIAHIGKQETPGERTKKCKYTEFHKGHFRDTGGEREVGAYYKQKAWEESRSGPPAPE